MKKLFYILLCTLFMGCSSKENSGQDNFKQNDPLILHDNRGNLYHVLTIDGCQYLEGYTNKNIFIHRGNCTNSAHFTKTK